MPSTVEEKPLRADPISPRIVREVTLVERVVFTGGHAGCGKSLITPIVGSLGRVEMQKYDYVIEHLCCLWLFGKIQEDAAVTMIRMVTDMDLYNMAMSREVNFRFSDLSSVFKNPGGWRYIRRLFQPGDAAAVERIRKTNPIPNFLTHNVLVISPLLFRALGERLRIIEVVRHPLYMIKQWHLYIQRFGTDVRDFTVWFDYKGHPLPFFAHGWEEKFLGANSMDRVIYSIEHLSSLGRRVMERLTESQKANIMTISFERFVLDPWLYLRQMEQLLGTHATSTTRRELKRQNVPRRMIAQGIAEPIYKQYGWEPPEKEAGERRELDKRRQFAARIASADGMKTLDRMCREYEAAYLNGHL